MNGRNRPPLLPAEERFADEVLVLLIGVSFMNPSTIDLYLPFSTFPLSKLFLFNCGDGVFGVCCGNGEDWENVALVEPPPRDASC